MSAWGVAATDHQLGVYDDDAGLVNIARRMSVAELALGHSVMVIAGAAVLARLGEEIAGAGLDLDSLVVRRRYTGLDAHDLLDVRVSGGESGIARFRAALTAAVDQHPPATRLLVITELASMLCSDGRLDDAAMLEQWLNELAWRRSFALCCVSRLSDVVAHRDLGVARRICAPHSAIHSPPSYLMAGAGDDPPPDVSEIDHVVLPVPEAVGAVRRFVAGALRAWRLEELTIDAVLIASELATNAIRYSGGPFHVRVERRVRTVVVSVRDLSRDMPVVKAPSAFQPDGRGVALVQRISRRWGVSTVQDGKIVWAELGTYPS